MKGEKVKMRKKRIEAKEKTNKKRVKNGTK